MHPNPRRILPILLALAGLAALAYWYFEVRPAQATTDGLTASGTIVITQVQIGAEIGGKVIEVSVGDGEVVKTGDTLVRSTLPCWRRSAPRLRQPWSWPKPTRRRLNSRLKPHKLLSKQPRITWPCSKQAPAKASWLHPWLSFPRPKLTCKLPRRAWLR
jgi:hypothetical protein